MKKKLSLDPKHWRKFTDAERKKYTKALVKTFGKAGRPALSPEVKKKSIHIKLDPDIIRKFKAKAKKMGRPYQTLINEALKKAA